MDRGILVTKRKGAGRHTFASSQRAVERRRIGIGSNLHHVVVIERKTVYVKREREIMEQTGENMKREVRVSTDANRSNDRTQCNPDSRIEASNGNTATNIRRHKAVVDLCSLNDNIHGTAAATTALGLALWTLLFGNLAHFHVFRALHFAHLALALAGRRAYLQTSHRVSSKSVRLFICFLSSDMDGRGRRRDQSGNCEQCSLHRRGGSTSSRL